jgi:single-strand DNA-binding protein
MARRTSATPVTSKTKASDSGAEAKNPGQQQVTITGRLCADPILRRTSSGKSVSSIRVAVNDGPEPQFQTVVAWGRTAEVVCQYLTKGRLIQVDGRSQDRSWQTKDGAERHGVEITAFRIQFLRGHASTAPAAEEVA